MEKQIIVFALFSLLMLYGCTEDSSPVDTPELPEDSPEELVVTNCLTVQQAVEEFAAQNNGSYPMDVDSDTTLLGNTLIDLLSNGERLENPFTHLYTEPIDGIADNPGETGYIGHCISYAVTGYGIDTIIVVLDNIEELEDSVIANCLTVQQAVEEFAAQNNGSYPGNVDSDTNLLGNTVIDLLPGGDLLRNPFTWCATEPVNMTAVTPGQTGYVPVFREGVYIGYCITGTGHENWPWLIVISKP